jgi:hypothetical protein
MRATTSSTRTVADSRAAPRRGITAGERRRRTAGALLAAWSLLLQGCYESLPLQQETPPTAQRVELVLNDRGRAAVADKLGVAVDKVEGTVVGEDADSYTMSVFRVSTLTGSGSTWTGQQVAIAKDGTTGFQVRRLNKTRTALLAGGVVVGLVGIFAKSLNLGGASAEVPPTDTPGPQKQLRPPHNRFLSPHFSF